MAVYTVYHREFSGFSYLLHDPTFCTVPRPFLFHRSIRHNQQNAFSCSDIHFACDQVYPLRWGRKTSRSYGRDDALSSIHHEPFPVVI